MFGFTLGVLWTILMAILAHMAYSNGGMYILPIYSFLTGAVTSAMYFYFRELRAQKLRARLQIR